MVDRLKELEAAIPEMLYTETPITMAHRSSLVSWLVHVVSYYNLKPATLVRIISAVDHYYLHTEVELTEFQMLGAACVLYVTARYDSPYDISSKNENHSATLEIATLFTADPETLDRKDNEVHQFFIEHTIPCSIDFLSHINQNLIQQGENSLHEHRLLIMLFLEITAVCPLFFKFKPSTIALSSVILAFLTNDVRVNVARCCATFLDDFLEFYQCTRELFNVSKERPMDQPGINAIIERYFDEQEAGQFLNDASWADLEAHFLH